MRVRRNITAVAAVIFVAMTLMCGCSEKEKPTLSSDKNIVPPDRVLTDQTGKQVVHNWIELPEVDGSQTDHKFATHYTTIGGKRVRNYSMLYDTKHRVALWVAYPLHNFYLGSVGRTDTFLYDPSFSTSVQPQVAGSGYFGSPYNRGHQIPSADRLATVEANRQTFYCTNMTAQNGTLNQNYWAGLEGFVRSKICKDTLFVVTGCVVPQSGGTTRQGATVPTAYFKALLRTQRGSSGVYPSDGNAMCIAFWKENKSDTGSVTAADAMSVAALEDRLGYELFPAISRTVKEQMSASRWGLN